MSIFSNLQVSCPQGAEPEANWGLERCEEALTPQLIRFQPPAQGDRDILREQDKWFRAVQERFLIICY